MVDQFDLDKDRADLRGADLIPPPGKLATSQEIANFWGARDHWNDEQQARFLADQKTLERRDPEESKRERLSHTERMRTEIRNETAKEMTPEEISQRYKGIGSPVNAEQFEKSMRHQLAGEDEKAIDAFRTKEAVRVLLLEERVQINAGIGAELDEQKKPPPGQEPPEPSEPAPPEPPEPLPPGPAGNAMTVPEPQAPAKELKFSEDRARHDDEPKQERAPSQSQPGEGRTLVFSEDRERQSLDYNSLKRENAQAPPQGQGEGRTLSFSEDKGPTIGHGR